MATLARLARRCLSLSSPVGGPMSQVASRPFATRKRTGPARPVGDEDAGIDELHAIDVDPIPQRQPPAATRATGSMGSLMDGLSSLEEDEDLLAPLAPVRDDRRDGTAAKRRQPWREPMFVARSQAPEGVDAQTAEQLDLSGGGGGGSPWVGRGSGSDKAAGVAAQPQPPKQPVVPPAPRPSMPELYALIPQDPVSRILEAASGKDVARSLRSLDGALGGGAGARGGQLSDDEGGYDYDDEDRPEAVLPTQGTGVDYCVFCYHGTSFLRADNCSLLVKFISERGSILPRRFTRCCAKHQRKLARTIRRSRALNLITWHSKPHPKLRFSSLTPKPLTVHVPGAPPLPSSSAGLGPL